MRAPVKFTARNSDGTLAGPAPWYYFGDGSDGTNGVHRYSSSGTYEVTCKTIYHPTLGRTRISEMSDPHLIKILEDTASFPDTLVQTIQLGPESPAWACVTPDGGWLYVARARADSVLVVSTSTDSVVAVVAVQDSPVCCVVSTSGERVYVLNARSGSVSAIRTSDNTVIITMATGANPNCLATDPSDSLLFVSYADAERVDVFRADGSGRVAQVDLGCIASSLRFASGGRLLYVTSERDDVLKVVRVPDFVITASKGLAGGPTDCAFSPGGETAYVACPSGTGLAVLSVSDLNLLHRLAYDTLYFSEGRYITDLAGGACFYVTYTSSRRSRVAVVRFGDSYLLRNIDLGAVQAGPAVSLPDRSRVYVPTSSGVRVLGLRPRR